MPFALVPDNAVNQLIKSLSPSLLAKLRLNYRHTEFGTVLNSNLHEGPLRVQKALYPEGKGICHTVIIHPPSGIAGGDTLDIDVSLDQGTHVVLSTPSASKWYKAHKNPSNQYIQFSLGEDAKLDWLPQENLFFKGANSNIRTRLNLTSSSSFIGWEATMLGRQASGEDWSAGQIRMRNEIHRNGKLLWVENGQVDAEDAYTKSLPQLGSWPVFATLWSVGSACSNELAGLLADSMPWTDHLKAGVTYLPQGVLLVRVVSDNIELTRNLLVRIWTQLRPFVHDVQAQPLRLWAS